MKIQSSKEEKQFLTEFALSRVQSERLSVQVEKQEVELSRLRMTLSNANREIADLKRYFSRLEMQVIEGFAYKDVPATAPGIPVRVPFDRFFLPLPPAPDPALTDIRQKLILPESKWEAFKSFFERFW